MFECSRACRILVSLHRRRHHVGAAKHAISVNTPNSANNLTASLAVFRRSWRRVREVFMLSLSHVAPWRGSLDMRWQSFRQSHCSSHQGPLGGRWRSLSPKQQRKRTAAWALPTQLACTTGSSVVAPIASGLELPEFVRQEAAVLQGLID